MENVQGVITAIVIVIALMLGIVLVDTTTSAAPLESGDIATIERDAAAFGDGPTGFVRVNSIDADNYRNNLTVYKTTGYAARLSGANDSQITASDGVTLGNDTSWHVSVWAQVNGSASGDTREVVAISDGEVRIYYNGSANEWAAWYFRQDTLNTYEVTVPTNSPVGNLTNIQARANDTHLTVYRNGTQGTTADITSSSSVAGPTGAGNWHGTIEELRTWDEALDSANRSKLVTSPIEQRPNTSRTMRLLYDDPYDNDVAMPIRQTSADATNVTFARRGFANVTVSESGDYNVQTDGPAIEREPGGALDGAPIAYADYGARAGGVDFPEVAVLFSLAGVIPLVIVSVLGYRMMKDL